MRKADQIQGESIWSREISISERSPLEGDIETEAAVIGAGMAGILTAYFLQRQGKKVVVLEADRIAGGQTQNTTAKITSQHGLIYADLVKKCSWKQAKLYAEANENAIRLYENIIRNHNIDCSFAFCSSYLYSRMDGMRLEEEAETAKKIGIDAFLTENTELPFPVEAAMGFPKQAKFHPLAFIRDISRELTIYEKTKATSVHGHRIMTDRGTVTAEYVIFAAHYPFLIVPGFYFMRQHQERSYVVAVSGAEPMDGMYYSVDEGGFSFRSSGDLVLLGGGGHRTGVEMCGVNSGVYEELTAKAQSFYPDSRIEAKWAAQDCVSHDGIPFIGKYSVLHPYWYVATGFKKWGMTSSMVAAKLISDQICGVDNPYSKLFSPQRLLVRASLPDFLKDIGVSARGLSTGLFHPERRCTHMGCACRWNPDENTWDCPCHGSRFGKDGELADGPAQRSIGIKRLP